MPTLTSSPSPPSPMDCSMLASANTEQITFDDFLVAGWHLMGHRDLAAFGRRLEDRQADLDRGLPPAAVVQHRLAVDHTVVELVDLRLAAPLAAGDRDLALLIAVDQDALLRLPHVAAL